MTVPGDDSGEKAQDHAGEPEPAPEVPGQHPPYSGPDSPPGFANPSGPPPAGYAPRGYPPPGYPPPPPGYPPPQWQQSGSPYPSPPGYPPAGYAPNYPTYPYTPPHQAANGVAVAAMSASLTAIPFAVLGLGIGFFGLLAILLSVTGVVLGAVALNQFKHKPQRGRGMALTGIITGSVYLAIFVIGAILALAAPVHR